MLLTQELKKAFQKQGDTSEQGIEEIKVIAKFFNPAGAGTWYLYEYNDEYREFMGYVNLGDPVMAELGAVSLDELESVQLPMGLKIERDMFFPIGKYTVKDVMDKVQSGEHI